MGATRLPGKVLRRLGGRTVLDHVVSRVKQARLLDGIVVATTIQPDDDAVVAECADLKVPSFRGSEQDVLSRYFQAANEHQAQGIVRVTADCPLFDGMLLSEMLDVFLAANESETKIDYLSNTQRRTFPRGLDAEIFTFEALAQAYGAAVQAHEREHVTPYLYQHPQLFRLHSFEGPKDLSSYRWTLDTPEDWEFVSAVYGALGSAFKTADVLQLLEAHPELAEINSHVEQKSPPVRTKVG